MRVLWWASTPEDFVSDDFPIGTPSGRVIELFSARLESAAYVLGGSTYEAPGQLVGDFVKGKASTALGSVEPSYKPG